MKWTKISSGSSLYRKSACGKHAEIKLPNGAICLIDLEDLKLFEKWPSWREITGHVRLCRYENKSRSDSYLHVEIAGKKPGYEIDHINRNGLDNRRSNLRHVTRSENALNKLKVRSKYGITGKCVFKRPLRNRIRPWTSYISWRGKRHHLGYYSSELDAATAYNAIQTIILDRFAIYSQKN